MNGTLRAAVRIARHELLLLSRDPRSVAALAVVFSLCLAVVISGRAEASRDRTQRQQAHSLDRALWLSQAKTTPHDAAHHGLFLFRPVTELAWFDSGLDPFAGQALRLEVHRFAHDLWPPAGFRLQPIGIFGFTPAAFIAVVASLVLLSFMASAIASEKEMGTWSQLLASGVTPLALYLGKFAGRLTPILVVLTPVWLQLLAEIRVETLGLTCLLLLFLSSLSITALLISTRTSSSARSFQTVACFWFCGAILAPPLINSIAHAFLPTPDASGFEADISRRKAELPTLQQRMERTRASETGNLTLKGLALLEEERDLDRIQDEAFSSLHRIYRQHDRWMQWAAFASPFLAIRSLSATVCGLDLPAWIAQTVEAEGHRRRMVRLLNEAEAMHGDHHAAPFVPSYLAGGDLWQQLPDYQILRQPLAHRLAHRLPEILSLTAWLVLPLFALLRSGN